MTQFEGALKDYLLSTADHQEAAEHLDNACQNLRSLAATGPFFARHKGSLYEVRVSHQGDLDVYCHSTIEERA